MLIHQPLEYWARIRPDSPFARDGDRQISYGEMLDTARRAAQRLVGEGIRPGDRITVLSDNRIELFVGYYAASFAGAVFVPVNPRLAPAERRHIVSDSTCRLLFAVGDLFDPAGVPEGGPKVVVLGGEAPEGTVAFEDWLAEVDPDTPLPIIDEAQDAFQAYTSGTTGRPKGAILTHRRAVNVLHRWQIAGARLEPDEALYVVMPAYVAAALFLAFGAVYNGACLELVRQFDPAQMVRDLDERTTGVGTAMPPTMVQGLLGVDGVEGRRFEHLKWIMYGAAPISLPVLRQALATFDCDFMQGFGQTEAAPVSWLLPAHHREALAGREELLSTVGKPTIGVEMQIVDAMGKVLDPGEPGEIRVRSDHVMKEYWNEPEMTAETQRDGWHHTGDVGYLDDEGFLHIVDRSKDLIITGGFNVYPREVEVVMESFPEVAQVAVIGSPHEKWGEQIVAVVKSTPGAEVSADDLIARCREQLAKYKTPSEVRFVEDFPLNANGKIQKNVLRERFA